MVPSSQPDPSSQPSPSSPPSPSSQPDPADDTIVDVTISGPDPDWLADHTRMLVERRLVACGNIIPAVRSIYRWEGTVEDDREAVVVLHTRLGRVEEIIGVTNEAHPNETVQILATEVVAADPAYRAWVLAETTG
jgi:periplasmic divalent cation tolerance protein